MKKKLVLLDNNGVKDKNMFKGGNLFLRVKREDGTEFLKHIDHNECITGGSQLVLAKMFRLGNDEFPSVIKTFDTSGDTSLGSQGFSTGAVVDNNQADRRIFGFALGTDGGSDTSVNKIFRYAKGWRDGYLMPLVAHENATVESGSLYPDPVDSYKQMYTCRRIVDNQAYYFAKLIEFEHTNSPVGGTHVDDPDTDMYGSETDIETMSQSKFKVSANDLTYYFDKKLNNLPARYFNSIKILAGRKVWTTINGVSREEYVDVIVTNVINTNAMALGIKDEIDLVYRMEF